MNYFASCNCGKWQVSLSVPTTTKDLVPRVCDCDFCQAHPSAIVSDPKMTIHLLGGDLQIEKCGDQLASFYLCAACHDLLAVGSQLDGKLRGAVNANLFREQVFQEATKIHPKLLSAKEKQARWDKLWGELIIQESSIS